MAITVALACHELLRHGRDAALGVEVTVDPILWGDGWARVPITEAACANPAGQTHVLEWNITAPQDAPEGPRLAIDVEATLGPPTALAGRESGHASTFATVAPVVLVDGAAEPPVVELTARHAKFFLMVDNLGNGPVIVEALVDDSPGYQVILPGSVPLQAAWAGASHATAEGLFPAAQGGVQAHRIPITIVACATHDPSVEHRTSFVMLFSGDVDPETADAPGGAWVAAVAIALAAVALRRKDLRGRA